MTGYKASRWGRGAIHQKLCWGRQKEGHEIP